MARNRVRLFSVVLDCFAPARQYNNIDLPEQIPATAAAAEEEYTEDFEEGVYITVRRLASGSGQVKRVKFSRELFSERQANLWWEENRVRVHQHYASTGN